MITNYLVWADSETPGGRQDDGYAAFMLDHTLVLGSLMSSFYSIVLFEILCSVSKSYDKLLCFLVWLLTLFCVLTFRLVYCNSTHIYFMPRARD